MDEIIARDVYLRHVVNGKAQATQQIRAWDPARLIEARIEEGKKSKDPFTVEVRTEAQYIAERRPR